MTKYQCQEIPFACVSWIATFILESRYLHPLPIFLIEILIFLSLAYKRFYTLILFLFHISWNASIIHDWIFFWWLETISMSWNLFRHKHRILPTRRYTLIILCLKERSPKWPSPPNFLSIKCCEVSVPPGQGSPAGHTSQPFLSNFSFQQSVSTFSSFVQYVMTLCCYHMKSVFNFFPYSGSKMDVLLCFRPFPLHPQVLCAFITVHTSNLLLWSQ